MRNKRVKIILIVLLILLAIPKVQHLSSYGREEVGWRFANFYYIENRHSDGTWICYDSMPVPKYSYGYESMFLDIGRDYDYCDGYEWWRDKSISLFIGVEDWYFSIYLPVLWLSISDNGTSFRLFKFDSIRW